jgi:hypothetical protein
MALWSCPRRDLLPRVTVLTAAGACIGRPSITSACRGVNNVLLVCLAKHDPQRSCWSGESRQTRQCFVRAQSRDYETSLRLLVKRRSQKAARAVIYARSLAQLVELRACAVRPTCMWHCAMVTYSLRWRGGPCVVRCLVPNVRFLVSQ